MIRILSTVALVLLMSSFRGTWGRMLRSKAAAPERPAGELREALNS